MIDFSRSGPSGAAFARCAPFGVFIACLAIGSLVEEPWVVVARSVLVAALLLWFWPRYRELRDATARGGEWLVAGMTGLAVFAAWITLDHDALVFTRAAGFAPLRPEGGIDWPLALLRLAGFALVVPVMEELFWRSFLLRWIDDHDFLSVAPAKVGVRALLITSVLFALEHNQWLAGAVAGAAYGWLYMRTGNLWLPIFAHALTNLSLGAWILWTRNWQFW